MATAFRETFRSLSADGHRRSVSAMLGASALLLGWGSWLFAARVPIYEVSDHARLELIDRVSSVSSTVAGRVVAVHADLGQIVDAGDVVAQLDARELVDRVAELEARMRMIAGHREALSSRIEILNCALDEFRESARARIPEEEARLAAAEASAGAAEAEVARFERLRESGSMAEMDLIRTLARARNARASAEAIRLGLVRLEQDLRVQEEDRKADIEELRVDLRRLEGELDVAAASAAVTRGEVENHALRAPAPGVVAERVSAAVGSVVAAGQEIVTIVHPGPVRVTAQFQAARGLGRIRSGQSARVDLIGFPSTEYGSLEARVLSTGSEPRLGRIHVELELVGATASRIPVQHGLAADVRVEVERLSPAVMLLRAVGKLVDRETDRDVPVQDDAR